MTDSSLLAGLSFHAVDQGRWPDFERLFESKGGPKHCWCMVWRATPEEARHSDPPSRKAAMARRVAAGVPVGLLAYQEREPVAWCSVAPRATFRRLVSDGSSDQGIWSLTCFFALRRLRGLGLTRRLIAAAVEHAKSQGAAIVEAYPVEQDSPSYRFMGFVPTFQKLGFQQVGREGKRRHVLQLVVRG